MRAHLAALWAEVRDSFWFLPALLTLAALVLAEAAVNLDERVNIGALPGLTWVYTGSADGARSLLAAIAMSVLGVAGTVFSITIAALVLASGQMGPRLLERFVRDRGNQLTLGIFLSTFAYALWVLRTVRSGAESPFVPHLAVTLGLLLALVSLGVLIYFIHHIAHGINVGQVVGLVGRDLAHTVRERFPAPGEHAHERREPEGEPAVPLPFPLRATKSGYVQSVDLEALVRTARRHGGQIELLVRPGDFLFPGAAVARLSSPFLRGTPQAIVTGPRRISRQDVEFSARQLVEIAVRSLSPAINDPFSAITCLDYLGAALCMVAGRSLPSAQHFSDGRLRLTVPVPDYDGLTDAMFHQIRQNGGDHPAVLIRMLEVLTAVAECERLPERRQALHRHAELVRQAGEQETWLTADHHDLEERYRRFQRTSEERGGGYPVPQKGAIP